MKIRKNHVRKHYRYNVNRKTLRKTRSSTGQIKDPVLKKIWEDNKNPNKNFYEMGLSSDPNKTVKMPNYKKDRLKVVKIVNGFKEEEIDDEELMENTPERPKGFVVQQLEETARAPRELRLKLPKGYVKQLTYFLDKHKLNYKAMAADKRNFEQWTWRQFRTKIRKFMTIPQQFNEYLKKQNLQPGEKLPWPEYDSEGETN